MDDPTNGGDHLEGGDPVDDERTDQALKALLAAPSGDGGAAATSPSTSPSTSTSMSTSAGLTVDLVRRRREARERRRRLGMAGGGLAVAAAAAAIVALAVRPAPSAVRTIDDPGTTAGTTTGSTTGGTTGSSRPEPERGPFPTIVGEEAPAGAWSAWTGADGRGTIPEPPLEMRGDVLDIWTGRELVVWGGDIEAFNMGLSGGDRSFGDGAAFDPVAGTWRTMAPSPLTVSAASPVGVMSLAGLVVIRGDEAAVWNPDTDTWRSIEMPHGATDGGPYDLTPVGPVAVSVAARLELDLTTLEWRALPEPPVDLQRSTSTWTGTELIVVGGPGTPFTSAQAFAYEPVARTWRELASPPSELHAEALDTAWDGRRVVTINYDMVATAYDPASDTWTTLTMVPARFSEWSPTLVALGDLLVASFAQTIAVLHPDGTWVPLPYDGLPVSRPRAAGPDTVVDVGWSRADGVGSWVIGAFDPEAAVASAERIQVGVASIPFPSGAEIVDARFGQGADGGPVPPSETVRVELNLPGSGRCTITSTYLGVVAQGSLTGGEEVASTADGQTRRWLRNPGATEWSSSPFDDGVDRLTITCANARAARALVEGTSFTR